MSTIADIATPAGRGRLQRPTFASVYDPRRNNFDAIRFVLASLVIWSHCYPLSGRPVDWFFMQSGQIDAGSFAVNGFFILSGFLIAQSWWSCPRLVPFSTKRLLRIGPALFAALALGAWLIGPANSTLSLGSYFASRETWGHFLGFLFHGHLSLSTVFTTNAVPNLVNAPLWSLRYEMLCYAGLAVLGVAGLRSWTVALIGLFSASWLWALAAPPTTDGQLPSVLDTVARLTACFSAGALFYAFRSWVPYDRRVAVVAVLVALGTFLVGGFRIVLPIAAGYLLFYAAFAPLGSLSRFGRYGDFSYGLYVFAYPVQQTIARTLGPDLSVSAFFLMSFLLTFPLAALSWHLVEAPALSFKPRAVGERPRTTVQLSHVPERAAAVSLGAAESNP